MLRSSFARLGVFLLSTLAGTAAWPIWAGEVFEISITERKPLCSRVTQGRCWQTQFPIWQHKFDVDKTLLIFPPESQAGYAAGMTDTLVVRLPGLFVPFVFRASPNDSPVSVRLKQHTASQRTEGKSSNRRTPTMNVEFQQGTRKRVLLLKPGTWQALEWNTLKTPSASSAESARNTQDKPDFYFRVRLENDNLSH